MKQITPPLIALLLLGSSLACVTVPTIDFGPTLEVGPLQQKDESIPLGAAESVDVEVLFGVGELTLAAGEDSQLFSGHFTYNVAEWEPEITYGDGKLTVKQGESEGDVNWTGDEAARNEWDIKFSPQVPLAMDVKIGAGKGELDFTGLQIEQLDLNLGAGDFAVRFDEPNAARMGHLNLNAGASKLEVTGVGNASPERVVVRGGLGDIAVDLTGDWARSADIEISAGLGKLALRLPDGVGVRVDVESGSSEVTVSGLQRSGDYYVNAVYGETETTLEIKITAGAGAIDLEVAQ